MGMHRKECSWSSTIESQTYYLGKWLIPRSTAQPLKHQTSYPGNNFLLSRSATHLHLYALCIFWGSYAEVYLNKAGPRSTYLTEIKRFALRKSWAFHRAQAEWRWGITSDLWLTKNELTKLRWKRAICVCRWNETTFLLKFHRERYKVLPLWRKTLAGGSSFALETSGVPVSSRLSMSQPRQQRCQQLLACMRWIRISGLKWSSTSTQHC